jgi:hypothetical protein
MMLLVPFWRASPASAERPDFIPTVRAYGGAGYDDFQRRSMKELGLGYVQGLVDFTWGNIQRSENVWKWAPADEQMDQLAKAGLKVIALVICPKSPGLPWDERVTRTTPRFIAECRYALTDPEVVVPLLNAAYDGIKRADPKTIVIGFNFATTAHSPGQWEEYHRRAFALAPKFDWYGVQSLEAGKSPSGG